MMALLSDNDRAKRGNSIDFTDDDDDEEVWLPLEDNVSTGVPDPEVASSISEARTVELWGRQGSLLVN